MLCVPPFNAEVVKLAVRLAFRRAEPMVVLPSRNRTVPVWDVGVGDVPDVLAVNVTDCPAPTGLAEARSVVVDR